MTNLLSKSVKNLKAINKLRKLGIFVNYIEQNVVPPGLENKYLSTFLSSDYFGHDGIEMHDADQVELLKKWQSSYGNVFRSMRDDPEINASRGQAFIENGYYRTPDVEIYASMILDYQPKSIIEIGAGFSTLIARKIVNQLNTGSKITAIDPEPRTDIGRHAHSVIRKRIEDVQVDDLPLGDRSILFIDSSHVTRSKGDIPHIYNKIFPGIPAGTLVHVHDICIPYDYPYQFQKLLYTEQYILQALLSHSPRYRVVFATYYMTHKHPEIMQATFSDVVGKSDRYHGFSFWVSVENS